MTRIERNLVALAIGILLGVWTGASWATGGHVVVPVIVKPPVVVVPPPVPAPPPPSVAVPPPSSAAAPQPQPSGGGSGPGAMGWAVMGGVAVYFGAVIRSHWLWCAEDDRKPAKERKCYRPLRDGMPK